MWILHLLPDAFLEWIVNVILVIGVVSTFLSFFVINKLFRFIPGLARYYIPAQIISIVLFTAGVYFKGGYSTEMIWRERVRELEEQIKQAEQRSNQINQELEEERKKKQKVRVEYYNTIKERIKVEEKVINGDCRINPAAVEIINDAAKGPPAKDKK
jgi:type VI protein secretion system component VasK